MKKEIFKISSFRSLNCSYIRFFVFLRNIIKYLFKNIYKKLIISNLRYHNGMQSN